MRSNVDLAGLDRLIARANALASNGLDATLLMKTWMGIIEEDNRKGVLAGLDKDGNAMPRVTYRPVGKAARPNASQRNTTNSRARKGTFGGYGPAAAGFNNNLSSAEYRRLGGPALAPRGAFSRVITNLRTAYEKVSAHVWTAYGMWFEVVSTKGKSFLPAHFTGARAGRGGRTKLPVRDLRGVRPEGREKARKAATAWLSDQVRWVAKGGSRAA